MSTSPWVEYYNARLAIELQSIPGVRPGTKRGDAVLAAAVRLVEELLGTAMLTLEDTNSSLRQELRDKRVSLLVLDRQLNASHLLVREFHKTKNHRFVRAALGAVGALSLAVAGGYTEGRAGRIDTANHGRPGSDIQRFNDLAQACAALDEAIEEAGGYQGGMEGPGTADAGPPHETDNGAPPATPHEPTGDDVDDDAFKSDPWFRSQDSEGRPQLEEADAAEASSWKAAGFSPEEAYEWRLVGATTDTASAWRAHDFEPFTADSWARQGFTPAAAGEWTEAGFEPGVARDWRIARFDPDEASTWHAEDVDPADAEKWRDEGFDPDEASDWIDQGVTPAEAVERSDHSLFNER